MPTYKILFTNGEKRELICKADEIVENDPRMIKFLRKDREILAMVPSEKILYIERLSD